MRRRVLGTGLWLGGVALATVGAMAVAGSAKNRPVRARSTVTDPQARQIADLVDTVVQDRFRRPLDQTFGLSRVARPGDERMTHSQSMTEADKPRLEKSEASGRAWRVLFYQTRSLASDGLKATEYAHQGGLTDLASSEVSARRNMGPAFYAAATQELKGLDRYLVAGRSAEAGVDGWRLFARPVLADKSCVSCHAGARAGENLGTVVYAVEQPQ
jgi:hypothetical protein